MGWLDRMFDRSDRKPADTADGAPSVPENDPATIRVFDAYGRVLEIPREEWRTGILKDHFNKNWNDPDGLAALIVNALQDGFVADALEPARQLARIDTQPVRSAVLLGVALIHTRRFAEAENVLFAALMNYGEDAALLTNLAKAQQGLGKREAAETTLWRSLEADPNQDNGLLWYAALQREREGEAGALAAFQRVAGIRGSWRAQLWLARAALAREELEPALDLYRHVLETFKPAPADALMQMSGDLGNHGYLSEIVELCAPLFDPSGHGLPVGANLMKCHAELGDAPSARRILELLYAQQRPDWRDTLLYWEAEIDKLDKGFGPVPHGERLQMTLLSLDGPIWAREGSTYAELFPAKAPDALHLAFVCGSAEGTSSEQGPETVVQPADSAGRLSRALPMYLAEQTHLATHARVTCLVPWMKQGGFVLCGRPWESSLLGATSPNADYTVLLHLLTAGSPWRAAFRVVRGIDDRVLATWEQPLDLDRLADAIQVISSRLLRELAACAGLARGPVSEWLFPPEAAHLPLYLLALEQALAVSCAALAPDTRPFLFAERSILDNMIHLAVEEPYNVACRFLLLTTLDKEARARPDVAAEFRSRVERLQREHPLPEPAQGIATAAIHRIYDPAP
jgi:tetratricopeptide (TPR) repeat protein